MEEREFWNYFLFFGNSSNGVVILLLPPGNRKIALINQSLLTTYNRIKVPYVNLSINKIGIVKFGGELVRDDIDKVLVQLFINWR